MKALKITTTISLTSGDTQGADCIVVIKRTEIAQERAGATTIPYTIYTATYKGKNAYDNGKKPIENISDFSPIFYANILITDYTDTKCEKAIIDAVKAQLLAIYPLNVTEITL